MEKIEKICVTQCNSGITVWSNIYSSIEESRDAIIKEIIPTLEVDDIIYIKEIIISKK